MWLLGALYKVETNALYVGGVCPSVGLWPSVNIYTIGQIFFKVDRKGIRQNCLENSAFQSHWCMKPNFYKNMNGIFNISHSLFHTFYWNSTWEYFLLFCISLVTFISKLSKLQRTPLVIFPIILGSTHFPVLFSNLKEASVSVTKRHVYDFNANHGAMDQ
jgi:hypothetical protein